MEVGGCAAMRSTVLVCNLFPRALPRYVGAGSRFAQPQVSLQSPGTAYRVSVCPVSPSGVEARMWTLSLGLADLPRTGTAVITYSYVVLLFLLLGAPFVLRPCLPLVSPPPIYPLAPVFTHATCCPTLTPLHTLCLTRIPFRVAHCPLQVPATRWQPPQR
jgi:hypothetical protein